MKKVKDILAISLVSAVMLICNNGPWAAAKPLRWADNAPRSDSSVLTKRQQQQLERQINDFQQMVERNRRLRREGKHAEAQYVYDFRRKYYGAEEAFVSSTKKNDLDWELTEFDEKPETIPLYVVASAYYVIDYKDQVSYEEAKEAINQQWHEAFQEISSITGEQNKAGCLLLISSYLMPNGQGNQTKGPLSVDNITTDLSWDVGYRKEVMMGYDFTRGATKKIKARLNEKLEDIEGNPQYQFSSEGSKQQKRRHREEALSKNIDLLKTFILDTPSWDFETEEHNNPEAIANILQKIRQGYREGSNAVDLSDYGNMDFYSDEVELSIQGRERKFEIEVALQMDEDDNNEVNPQQYNTSDVGRAMDRQGNFKGIELGEGQENGLEIVTTLGDFSTIRRYLFGMDKPLRECRYRGYSSGIWRPSSAKYGCTRTDSSRDCNKDGIKGDQGHHGVDLYASINTECYAIADGTVRHADYIDGYGKAIAIKSDIKNRNTGIKESVYLLYAHLSQINVEKNDKINDGQIIGLSGDSGPQNLPETEHHLHFEVLKKWWPEYNNAFQQRFNPENFITIKFAK